MPEENNNMQPAILIEDCQSSNVFPSKDEDEFLFPTDLLRKINWNERKCSYSPEISMISPGPDLVLRPLCFSDFERGIDFIFDIKNIASNRAKFKGHLQLLEQLTITGDLNKKDYEARFRSMKNCPNTYYVIVIVDKKVDQVVASGGLILEQKFIHSAGQRGRIEDIVVSSDYRGKQLGKLLLDTLTLLGKELGCYKISLECKDPLVKFYESFGFKVDPGNNYMVQRFKE